MPRFDRAIDFGWFYLLTKPIFLTLDFFYKLHRQFRPRDHAADRDHQGALLPARQQILSRDEQDEAAAAGDGEAARAVRRRQGEAQPGDDGALQARRRQSDGGLPADRRSRSRCSSRSTRCSTSPSRCATRRSMAGSTICRRPTRPASSICSACLPFTAARRSRFLHIGAWPLIMGITMFLQQKLNPQPPDPMQAKMFMVLPVVFTFMLAQFAAGLVIYWAGTTCSRSRSNG